MYVQPVYNYQSPKDRPTDYIANSISFCFRGFRRAASDSECSTFRILKRRMEVDATDTHDGIPSSVSPVRSLPNISPCAHLKLKFELPRRYRILPTCHCVAIVLPRPTPHCPEENKECVGDKERTKTSFKQIQ